MRNPTRIGATGVIFALLAGAVCVGCSADDPTVSLEIRIVESNPADDLTEMNMVVWNGHRTYYAHDEVVLTGDDTTDATVVKQDDGMPAVRLILSEEARETLRRATRRNVGSRLGVIIDGQLQCTTPITRPLDSGIVMVTGHMLEPDARRCSRALREGAERRRIARLTPDGTQQLASYTF